MNVVVVTHTDKHQAIHSVTLPAEEDKGRDLKEEWHVPQNAQFSGFCHYVTHCISFKICFCILYKPLTDLGHVTSSLENKKIKTKAVVKF